MISETLINTLLIIRQGRARYHTDWRIITRKGNFILFMTLVKLKFSVNTYYLGNSMPKSI